MPRKSNLESSPLLANRVLNSSSTVKPDRLDQTRFTEIQQSNEIENNSARIIIYIAIVIAIGVIAALVVRNLSTSESQTGTETDTPVSAIADEEKMFEIANSIRANSAALNTPKDSDFVSALTSRIGDSATNLNTANLTSVMISKFQSFDRMELKFSTAKLPSVSVNFTANKRLLSIPLTGIDSVDTDIQTNATVGNVINTYKYNTAVPEIILDFNDPVNYRIFVQGNTLTIDLKKESVTLSTSPTPNPTTTGGTTTPTNPTPTTPSTTNLTNDFSQNKQSIVTTVNTNKIAYNNYFVYDANSYYEFSIGAEGIGGDDFIPNATAEYVTENGKNYIELTVNNLIQTPFSISRGKTAAQIEAETGLTTAGANFVGISLLDFSNGTAKYRIEVKRKADFKLLVQEWVDGTTDVLSIQIED